MCLTPTKNDYIRVARTHPELYGATIFAKPGSPEDTAVIAELKTEDNDFATVTRDDGTDYTAYPSFEAAEDALVNMGYERIDQAPLPLPGVSEEASYHGRTMEDWATAGIVNEFLDAENHDHPTPPPDNASEDEKRLFVQAYLLSLTAREGLHALLTAKNAKKHPLPGLPAEFEKEVPQLV